MFQLGLVDIILAEREREIETALRRRRWLKPEDGVAEVPVAVPPRSAGHGRALAARPKPTAW